MSDDCNCPDGAAVCDCEPEAGRGFFDFMTESVTSVHDTWAGIAEDAFAFGESAVEDVADYGKAVVPGAIEAMSDATYRARSDLESYMWWAKVTVGTVVVVGGAAAADHYLNRGKGRKAIIGV